MRPAAPACRGRCRAARWWVQPWPYGSAPGSGCGQALVNLPGDPLDPVRQELAVLVLAHRPDRGAGHLDVLLVGLRAEQAVVLSGQQRAAGDAAAVVVVDDSTTRLCRSSPLAGQPGPQRLNFSRPVIVSPAVTSHRR